MTPRARDADRPGAPGAFLARRNGKRERETERRKERETERERKELLRIRGIIFQLHFYLGRKKERTPRARFFRSR